MSVTFIHTADWQIGTRFGRFPEEARALLARQRIDAIGRIARLADQRRVDAVLVAGDVFDTGAVSDQTIRRTLHALEGFHGPWVLLPGNHDAALSESPWTRIEAIGRPENVLLATRPEPVHLDDRRMTILPAPLQRRHEAADLTEWFGGAATPEGSVRIGLAHGSVAELLPAAAEAPNPIARDRAERAGLDYLALGDWHGTLRIGPRTWYSGTPEADRYKANDQGNVLVVRLDDPGAPPEVETVRTGHYGWHELDIRIHSDDDVHGIDLAFAALGEPLATWVVALTLEGTVDLSTRAAVGRALDAYAARVHHLEVDDSRLLAEPSPDDLDAIDRHGFVRAAVDTLRARALDPADPERDAASLALQILYTEHRGQRG